MHTQTDTFTVKEKYSRQRLNIPLTLSDDTDEK